MYIMIYVSFNRVNEHGRQPSPKAKVKVRFLMSVNPHPKAKVKVRFLMSVNHHPKAK